MANPQCEHGFTRIANELLDAALLRLSAEETVMWLALVRVTYGYGRKEADVTREQLAGMCGQSPRTAARALAALAARGALYIQRNGPKPMTIRLEKDYEKWAVPKEVPDMAHQGPKEVPDMAHQGPKEVPDMAHQG
ncbi:MAG: hypothetical protein EOL86_11645, partial [Deltaproteobacteria bacterium]|nr:hypothetical protein [Deltaproteobacteria bacterium]